jgi:hypothetical protein
MLLGVILLTIYCTLMYVAGYRLFKIKVFGTNFLPILFWFFSPLSVPFVYLTLLMHDSL